MHDPTSSLPDPAFTDADPAAQRLMNAGRGVLRYGVVAILLFYGVLKFFEFEAQGIRPLIENHPLMSWMYPVFGIRGGSAVIGIIELTAAALMLMRAFRPRLSAIGSLIAAGTFVVTLTFLLTTPGALQPDNPMNGFLIKDLILLGASLYTAGEALAAARRR